jgi:hypothetical protein
MGPTEARNEPSTVERAGARFSFARQCRSVPGPALMAAVDAEGRRSRTCRCSKPRLLSGKARTCDCWHSRLLSSSDGRRARHRNGDNSIASSGVLVAGCRAQVSTNDPGAMHTHALAAAEPG